MMKMTRDCIHIFRIDPGEKISHKEQILNNLTVTRDCIREINAIDDLIVQTYKKPFRLNIVLRSLVCFFLAAGIDFFVGNPILEKGMRHLMMIAQTTLVVGLTVSFIIFTILFNMWVIKLKVRKISENIKAGILRRNELFDLLTKNSMNSEQNKRSRSDSGTKQRLQTDGTSVAGIAAVREK